MTDLNRAIHIGEFDPGSAASQFPVQIVPNNAMVAHSQAKVIADTTAYGGSFEFRFGVRSMVSNTLPLTEASSTEEAPKRSN